MKIKTGILLVLLSFTINSLGQVNNMLNYSFEKYTVCEMGNCSENWVTNWYQPTLLGENWCSYPCFGAAATAGVPSNLGGYQYARTGQCYGTISMTESGHFRQYLTGTLADGLTSTKKYCITFYVSLGDSVWYAVSALGAYLSNDSICDESLTTALPYIPQIENSPTNILTNKIDWVPVSGEYVANGREKFMTIGDFYSDTLSDFTYVGNGGIKWYGAVQTAYFIDDVYVRELTIANAGISASLNNPKIDTICVGDTVQIGKDTTTPGVSFKWLPTVGLSNPNITQPMATPSVTTTYTLTVINDSVLAVNNRGQACNCADSVTKDSVKIVVNRCGLGINQLKIENGELKIEPNPSAGKAELVISNYESGMKYMLEVTNIFGQPIETQSITSSKTAIDLSKEPNGMYFFKVLDENSIPFGQGKIIIEK